VRYLLSLFVCALFLSGCASRLPWADRFNPLLGKSGQVQAPTSTTDPNRTSPPAAGPETGDVKTVPASFYETASMDRF